MIASILFLVFASISVVARPAGDRVTSLPGAIEAIAGEMFAGYVNVSETRNMFYWTNFEPNTMKHDTLLVWFAGGPGCSGIHDFTNKNGPLHVNEDGSISFNSLSWSQFGSVLYTDSPVGTGFSYDSRGGPVHMNDSQAAIDMMTLLDAYFEYFPELQNAPVWLTGESYGGNYVPNLLSLLRKARPSLYNRVEGVVLSNPVINCAAQFPDIAAAQQGADWFYRGLIPRAAYNQWIQQQCDQIPQPDAKACTDLRNSWTWLNDLNMVHEFADACTSNATLGIDESAPFVDCSVANSDARTQRYLNRADVQAAIHARRTTSWANCVGPPVLEYSETFLDQTQLYRDILSDKKRVLILSGDSDIGVVTTSATQYCMRQFEETVFGAPTTPWGVWTVEGQMAGFVTQYLGGQLLFATVHGAGHMVSTYQPFAVFKAVASFIGLDVQVTLA